jgi:hypothetical protein
MKWTFLRKTEADGAKYDKPTRRKNREVVLVVIAGMGLSCTLFALTFPFDSRRLHLYGMTRVLTSVEVSASASAETESSPVTGVVGTALPRTVAQTPSKPNRSIGSVLITARHTGFEPSAITRPAGPVFFFVQNRSGFHEVALRLDREAGSRLYDVRVPRSKLDWQQVVDLHPGRYILTDSYHPDWICTITVTTK